MPRPKNQPAGSPGAICADAPVAPNPNNPVKNSGNTAFISHLLANSQQSTLKISASFRERWCRRCRHYSSLLLRGMGRLSECYQKIPCATEHGIAFARTGNFEQQNREWIGSIGVEAVRTRKSGPCSISSGRLSMSVGKTSKRSRMSPGEVG